VDVGELKAYESRVLATPAWVDRRAGIARIPIEDALRLVAQRGVLPSWPKVATAPGPAPAGAVK
jgi:hypothetical protein